LRRAVLRAALLGWPRMVNPIGGNAFRVEPEVARAFRNRAPGTSVANSRFVLQTLDGRPDYGSANEARDGHSRSEYACGCAGRCRHGLCRRQRDCFLV